MNIKQQHFFFHTSLKAATYTYICFFCLSYGIYKIHLFIVVYSILYSIFIAWKMNVCVFIDWITPTIYSQMHFIRSTSHIFIIIGCAIAIYRIWNKCMCVMWCILYAFRSFTARAISINDINHNITLGNRYRKHCHKHGHIELNCHYNLSITLDYIRFESASEYIVVEMYHVFKICLNNMKFVYVFPIIMFVYFFHREFCFFFYRFYVLCWRVNF